MTARLASLTILLTAATAIASCAPTPPEERRFSTPEEAVAALIDSAKAGNVDGLLALFGPEGRELVSSSDPATARRNREVFEAAAAEQWRLADLSSRRQGTDRRQRGLAVPDPTRERRRRVAVRHRGRRGRSAGAAHRPQRIGRHRHMPGLRESSAGIREKRPRRQARRSLCAQVWQRPRHSEWFALAGQTGRAAQPDGRPGRGGG